eukprot:scaffold49717_cov70-Phaeocystis_antarctica.AAC.2
MSCRTGPRRVVEVLRPARRLGRERVVRVPNAHEARSAQPRIPQRVVDEACGRAGGCRYCKQSRGRVPDGWVGTSRRSREEAHACGFN